MTIMDEYRDKNSMLQSFGYEQIFTCHYSTGASGKYTTKLKQFQLQKRPTNN